MNAEVAPGTSFEDAVRELEAIVERMDAGDLTLEQSLGAYQRGARLVKHCQSALESVRQRVQVLDGELLRTADASLDGGSKDA